MISDDLYRVALNQLHVKYLLVGGGIASSAAARAIRAIDPQGSMLLVGQEINRPYHRPLLSREYLLRERSRSQMTSLPVGWFDQNNVPMRTHCRATGLDTARNIVTLDTGEEVNFDRLLLATGAGSRQLKIPGASLPNVYSLRTLEDADRLIHAIDKAKSEGRSHANGRGRAAIVGGGLLALELAATLTQLGIAADLVVARSFPLHKYAGEQTGNFLKRYLESKNIAVHTSRLAERFEGDGRVQRVVLGESSNEASRMGGESIHCDFVIAAVGSVAHRELLRGTPISAEKAILVDDHCRTNLPDIYAAGDCAAILDPLFGKHRVLEHAESAEITGTIAGTNLAGGDAKYDVVGHWSTKIFDLAIAAWGTTRHVERRLIRGNPSAEAPDFVEIGVTSDGRISQMLAVNHSGDEASLAELVRRRLNITGIEEEIKDPTRALGEFLK